jgi:hypothetical protein
MFFSSWLRNGTTNRRPGASRRLAPSRFRPRLEALEDRWLPSTLTVTNPLDDGSGGTLRATIAAAASGDTIVFAGSLNGRTVALTGGELLLNKNLTIQGPGAAQLAISGNQLWRVFEVAANVQVSLADLTIRDGNGWATSGAHPYIYGPGGGIYNAGTLTVSGCTLSGNSASTDGVTHGGGIYNVGTLTVSGCTLSGNSALGFGGGICSYRGTLTVSGCTLTGNSADRGGGIYNGNGNGTLTASTLSGNSAHSFGGAIIVFGTLSASGCTVTGNSAGSGGGIFNGSTLTASSCTVSGNSAAANGGGVFTDAATMLTLSGCTLSGNSAANGGAIYHAPNPYVTGGTLTVSSCTITGNTADVGGGIYNAYVKQSSLTVQDSTITNNTANTKGGGIYNNGIASIQNTKVTSNSATLQGGGIFNDVNGTLTQYSSSVVSGNSAPEGADLDNLGHILMKKG